MSIRELNAKHRAYSAGFRAGWNNVSDSRVPKAPEMKRQWELGRDMGQQRKAIREETNRMNADWDKPQGDA